MWAQRFRHPESVQIHSEVGTFFIGLNDKSQIAVRLRDTSSRKRTRGEMTAPPRGH